MEMLDLDGRGNSQTERKIFEMNYCTLKVFMVPRAPGVEWQPTNFLISIKAHFERYLAGINFERCPKSRLVRDSMKLFVEYYDINEPPYQEALINLALNIHKMIESFIEDP